MIWARSNIPTSYRAHHCGSLACLDPEKETTDDPELAIPRRAVALTIELSFGWMGISPRKMLAQKAVNMLGEGQGWGYGLEPMSS